MPFQGLFRRKKSTGMFGPRSSEEVTSPTSSDPNSVFAFIDELNLADQDIIADQEKLVKQKSIMDIAGSTLAAWENLTAPLPDRMAAPRFTGTEVSLPVNFLIGQRNKQEGNLISQGRGLYRASGNSSIMPAISGSLVDLNNNFNTSLASTSADFIAGQQQQANQINNLNAEALSKANEYNANIVAQDNLRRSEIAGQMVSQIGQAMVDRKGGLINIKNMRNANKVYYDIAKRMVEAGELDKVYALFGGRYGFNTVPNPTESTAADEKVYNQNG